MNLRAVLLVAICAVFAAPDVVWAWASAGDAGDVRVTFANGRVTVIATDATLTEILQEWARVGGSRFVNAEKIPSAERLTLRLENETEMHAIEVLLRPVAGYVIAPRLAAAAGGSSLGNVVIQATTRAGSFAQAPRTVMQATASDEVAAPRFTNAPPRPDDDGPTRQEMPPPAPVPVPQPQQTQGFQSPMQPNAPMGQANPLQGTQTQTVPGLGAVTSSQPGAIIPSATPRPGGRPPLTPTQPRRPGGGG